MSTLKFTKDSARNLEDFYRTRDVIAQRAATMAALKITPDERVIDIGCGPGFLSEDIAVATGSAGSVLGVDISQDLISLCKDRDPPNWLNYQVGDATNIPAVSTSFDVVACTQVAEYIPDVGKVVSEIFRVLKPGGRALIVATDWDTVGWFSDDPARMARVLHAWEAHCAHPRLPRTLCSLLSEAGFDVAKVEMFPLVNPEFDEESYSFGISQLIQSFVTRGKHIAEKDASAWRSELFSLSAEGRYYFTSARMLFTAHKTK